MTPPPPDATTAARPTWSEAQSAFAKIGVLSFGGPAAQIALMHKVIVDERRWLTEQQFLNALSFCMLLPGPEAMQLATYAGWRLHGVRGGLMAGLWFVLPGALVVLALSAIYAAFGSIPLVAAVFLGIKAAVLVIVIEALLKVARRALKGRQHWLIAAAAFIAIFLFAAPFPLIVVAAASYGWVTSPASAPSLSQAMTISLAATTRTLAIWLTAWLVPLLVLATTLGHDHILARLGWFFSKLAVVTFGGAYAVLAYMGQDVVATHGWLSAGEMMTGLGLAETTPGPLILVTEFVGFLAAFKQGGWLLGLLGAAVALWATFMPCFLWIFAGAPYLDWIASRPRLKNALAAITAAVVGVILNLSIWFALHVLFTDVSLYATGPLRVFIPNPLTLDWRVVVLSTTGGILLLWLHYGIPLVLVLSSLLAIALHLATA